MTKYIMGHIQMINLFLCFICTPLAVLSLSSVPTWQQLSTMPNFSHEIPFAANGASFSSRPEISDKPTLYRERHGWCPYSERIWLALEVLGVDYDTVYIDNIYGRPSWYFGDTPQMRWENGKIQSESMDLVREVDKKFRNSSLCLYPEAIENQVLNKIQAFKKIFPSRARPSSRAAFLFRFDGEPLWKSEFDTVLKDTDTLLSETNGPFFCGSEFTAADIAWAPFLERYAAQLPCLHDGLDPKDDTKYPYLASWYKAMDDTIPAYSCKVQGDASSWRKVLTMAGYGNAGSVPVVISERMEDAGVRESLPLSADEQEKQQNLWNLFIKDRPYLAASPSKEAASVLIRNKDMIKVDIQKRSSSKLIQQNIPDEDDDLDIIMRALATVLSEDYFDQDVIDHCKRINRVYDLAAYLDQRMCVPRDMNRLSAGCIKRLASIKL